MTAIGRKAAIRDTEAQVRSGPKAVGRLPGLGLLEADLRSSVGVDAI